ncbi:hypothetical protein Y032_0012g1820 [Ancylostoma ceylanicum]|uniref:Uncharacterized protein n=1 Tax=Ancylostoma ceylanicum TaxID=53326 RepID=A0A016VEZ5_9BILA|nr:hypothetical protein Y032_0012g1820 [Ancylostoma ceylanicum]
MRRFQFYSISHEPLQFPRKFEFPCYTLNEVIDEKPKVAIFSLLLYVYHQSGRPADAGLPDFSQCSLRSHEFTPHPS